MSAESGSRRRLGLALCGLGLVLASPQAHADIEGLVSFTPAARYMPDMEPAEMQGAFGIYMELGPEDSTLKTIFGFNASHGEGTETRILETGTLDSLDLDFYEASVGAIWHFGEKRFNHYYGAGISHQWADGELTGTDRLTRPVIQEIDARSVGFYVTAGVAWQFGKHFKLGIEGRGAFFTELEFQITSGTFFNDKLNTGYFQLGPVFAVGW